MEAVTSGLKLNSHCIHSSRIYTFTSREIDQRKEYINKEIWESRELFKVVFMKLSSRGRIIFLYMKRHTAKGQKLDSKKLRSVEPLAD